MAGKKSLLVISHVLPINPRSGQQQRVFYSLRALRERFEVTFLTAVPTAATRDVKAALQQLCDQAIILDAGEPALMRAWNTVRCASYPLLTGLKSSNCRIGLIDFTPRRLSRELGQQHFDCVLFEYWHAVESVGSFQARGIPCVLDMHNVLWQAYEIQLAAREGVPQWWKTWALKQYRNREESAWRRFDGVIAINRRECKYVGDRVPDHTRVFYAPMGVELAKWPYGRTPARPYRIAYYGGLASQHNSRQALVCAREIMPRVWERHPEAELWIVGSNPPATVRALTGDKRIHVTGFVDNPAEILQTMSAVLCPWSGRYGFRSRLIEVLAVGIPLLVFPDAIFGMDLEPGRDLIVVGSTAEMADRTIELLAAASRDCPYSNAGRQTAEEMFSFDATYGRLALELQEWVLTRRGQAQCA